jgi:hypothetical protein
LDINLKACREIKFAFLGILGYIYNWGWAKAPKPARHQKPSPCFAKAREVNTGLALFWFIPLFHQKGPWEDK